MDSYLKNGMGGDSEVFEKIKLSFEKLASLKRSDIATRQSVLKEIEVLLSSNEQHSSDESKWNILLENTIRYLFDSLSDDSEKCREMSCKILSVILDRLSATELYLPYISTTFLRRLGKTDERESSEEVRLLEIEILYKVIDKYDGDLLKYFTDITSILSVCITDEYPEVKRKSCDCTSRLATKQQTNFHMISSPLLKALLHTISHQHFRTRTACVKAIGMVVRYGTTQDFEDALSHVTQRLFDYSPVVRTAVTEVIGCWLMNLKDRYSFFNRLIPLMLSALYDEVLDIRTKALNLWIETGEQYLNENENDYKDLIDYPRPGLENYPETEKRPTLGCRILIQRNMYSILPALIRDLTDWVPATRKKCAQVLYSLILHAEDKATMQLPSFIGGIVSAAKDEEKEIAKLALHCAELLGFFLDPNLICDSVMTLVHKSPSAVHLSIFAAVLRGNKKGLSSNCFQAICKLLSEPSICRVRQAEEQANLLLCVDGVVSSHNKIDYAASYQLFTILSTVSGLTTNTCISEKAFTLLQDIAKEQSCSLEALFNMHSVLLTKALTSNSELWTDKNPELPIFYFLVQSDYAGTELLKLAVPVMTTNLNLNKDVKLRSKVLTLLVKVFKKIPTAQDSQMSEKIIDLLRLGVFPNLAWSPGKAASSLRIVAVASLYEIVSKDCIDQVMLKSISDELLPILATLSSDDEMSNRLLSCKIMEFLLPKLYGYVADHKIHSLCHDFLECMDDASDDVRIITTKVLKAYIKTFPSDYDWNICRSYLKELYHNVLIHMDDKNEKVRESVLSLLKDIAFADPKLLLDEIEEKRYLMSAGKFCDDLVDHIKRLNV